MSYFRSCPESTYYLEGDGDLSGWQATRDPNGEGGGSYHRTNSNGSSVTLSFYGTRHIYQFVFNLNAPKGTGFQLIGYSTALYDVKVDEEPAVVGLVGPASGVLYFRDNLTMGSHVMTLTSRATSNVTALTFDKVILSNSGRNECVDDVFYKSLSLINKHSVPVPQPEPTTRTQKQLNTLGRVGPLGLLLRYLIGISRDYSTLQINLEIT